MCTHTPLARAASERFARLRTRTRVRAIHKKGRYRHPFYTHVHKVETPALVTHKISLKKLRHRCRMKIRTHICS